MPVETPLAHWQHHVYAPARVCRFSLEKVVKVIRLCTTLHVSQGLPDWVIIIIIVIEQRL